VVHGILNALKDQVALVKKVEVAPQGEMLLKKIGRDDGAPQKMTVDPNEPIEAAFERLYTMYRTGKLLTDRLAKVRAENSFDPFASYRTYLYDLLRKDGEENVFRLDAKPTSRVHHLPLMPLLSGDNPISNVLPSKFLRLTEYPWQPYKDIVNKTARQLDQGVDRSRQSQRSMDEAGADGVGDAVVARAQTHADMGGGEGHGERQERPCLPIPDVGARHSADERWRFEDDDRVVAARVCDPQPSGCTGGARSTVAVPATAEVHQRGTQPGRLTLNRIAARDEEMYG
jgi:hypothetical protein